MNFIFGFVIVLLIGFISSRLTLFRSEFSLGFRYIMFAGTEYLFIGLILGPHGTDVLTQEALNQLTPILSLGLGWIGLLIGLQFDRQIIQRISPHIWKIGITISLITFLFVGISLYLIRYFFLFSIPGPLNEDNALFVYPQLAKVSFCFILGWAATSSTYSSLALLKRSADARGEATKMLQLLTDIRTPFALLGMGFWYCLFHVSNVANIRRVPTSKAITSELPQSTTKTELLWSEMEIPEQSFIPPIMNGFMWLTLTILLGILLGWILHYLTSKRMQNNEMLLVFSGAVIFSAGLATYLHLSPLFVNFVMGLTLTNLPNFSRGRVSNLMTEQEKPFFVVFMILVGAMWPVIIPVVIMISLLYCLFRIMGLYVGMKLANSLFLKSEKKNMQRLGLAMIPQGGVAIALVVDYILIYPSPHADMVLGVVILSVVLNQLFGPALLTTVLRQSGEIDGTQVVSAQKNT